MAVTLVRYRHPYLPDATGTQCSVAGCWGWVDDPRHIFDPVKRFPVLPSAKQSAIKRSSPGHRWDDFDECKYPPCSAEPAEPCIVTSGPNAGKPSTVHHVGRKLREYADA